MPAAVACWVETSTPPMAMAGRSSGHTAQSSVLTGGTIEESARGRVCWPKAKNKGRGNPTAHPF